MQQTFAAEATPYAVPTLVRRAPEPVKKIIGDLSNTQRVPAGLDLGIEIV
jgi:circadian clock protein KaiB